MTYSEEKMGVNTDSEEAEVIWMVGVPEHRCYVGVFTSLVWK